MYMTCARLEAMVLETAVSIISSYSNTQMESTHERICARHTCRASICTPIAVAGADSLTSDERSIRSTKGRGSSAAIIGPTVVTNVPKKANVPNTNANCTPKIE